MAIGPDDSETHPAALTEASTATMITISTDESFLPAGAAG